MISNKKSYAMKMLQLALALSLLHVDPDNFLEQRLLSWDSRLELGDGDGWELEMLRAVPMVEYPYANRKSMPLIEDLVRSNFDILQESNYNQYNVTAYLLNVQSETTNQTAAVQELQLPTANTNSAASSNSLVLEQAASAASNTNNSAAGMVFLDSDLFLSMESLQDQRSIWEQNLADLNDFGDIAVSNNLYSGLPLKEEPHDNSYIDLNLDALNLGRHSSESSDSTDSLQQEGATALNDTFPNPSGVISIKTEEDAQSDHQLNQSLFLSDIPSCSSGLRSSMGPCKTENNFIRIKREEVLGRNMSSHQVDLSPFISQVELVKEVNFVIIFIKSALNLQKIYNIQKIDIFDKY